MVFGGAGKMVQLTTTREGRRIWYWRSTWHWIPVYSSETENQRQLRWETSQPGPKTIEMSSHASRWKQSSTTGPPVPLSSASIHPFSIGHLTDGKWEYRCGKKGTRKPTVQNHLHHDMRTRLDGPCPQSANFWSKMSLTLRLQTIYVQTARPYEAQRGGGHICINIIEQHWCEIKKSSDWLYKYYIHIYTQKTKSGKKKYTF